MTAPAKPRRDRTSKLFQSQQKPEGYVFGRPTLYRPEYCQLVIERMGQGFSLTAFAGTIGVSRNAVYEWSRAHADFDDAVSRARPARTLWLEQKLLRSQDSLEVAVTIWALRNADPDEWRNVRHQKHSHNVEIETLTDAQLHAIASQKRFAT